MTAVPTEFYVEQLTERLRELSMQHAKLLGDVARLMEERDNARATIRARDDTIATLRAALDGKDAP